MRNKLLFYVFLCFGFGACSETKTQKNHENGIVSDSLVIQETIQGFYTWYAKNQEKLGQIEFVDKKSTPLKLKEIELNQYFEELKKSGFVSEELVKNEIQHYKYSEKKWITQTKEEVPIGLEMDRFECAHDFIAPYNTGKVNSKISGNRASATLLLVGQNAGEKRELTYELVRENGKWLLAKLGCGN